MLKDTEDKKNGLLVEVQLLNAKNPLLDEWRGSLKSMQKKIFLNSFFKNNDGNHFHF